MVYCSEKLYKGFAMKVQNIKNVGVGIIHEAGRAAKKVKNDIKGAFGDVYAKTNLRKSLPEAMLLTGVFSLLSFLPNRKSDGKQGKVEKKSGNYAAFIYALVSFKKFFNFEGNTLKSLFTKLKNTELGDIPKTLKTNKANGIMYLISILGVKIATDIGTKGIDAIISERFNTKKLGD